MTVIRGHHRAAGGKTDSIWGGFANRASDDQDLYGVCHVYIGLPRDLDKLVRIADNAEAPAYGV